MKHENQFVFSWNGKIAVWCGERKIQANIGRTIENNFAKVNVA